MRGELASAASRSDKPSPDNVASKNAIGLANGAGVVAESTMDRLANTAGIYGASQPDLGTISNEDFEMITTRGFFPRRR